MRWTFDDLDRRIYDVMKAGGELSTRDVADRVGADRAKVYRRLVRMERIFADHDVSKEWMESTLADAPRPLYFFPATGDVLTAANFAAIDKIIAELKRIALSVGPSGTKVDDDVKRTLIAKYHDYLSRMAAKAAPRERAQIEHFERQLIAVIGHTWISDVLRFFGLRRFVPKERHWDFLAGAPLELPGSPSVLPVEGRPFELPGKPREGVRGPAAA